MENELVSSLELSHLLDISDKPLNFNRAIRSYIERGAIPEPTITKGDELYFSKEELLQRLGVKDLNEPFIDKIEAAKVLNLKSWNHVIYLATKGKIPSYRLTGFSKPKFYFRASELIRTRENVTFLWNEGFSILLSREMLKNQLLETFINKKFVKVSNKMGIEVLKETLLENKTHQQVANETNFTKERIRQIFNETVAEMISKLNETPINKESFDNLNLEVFYLRKENKKLREEKELEPIDKFVDIKMTLLSSHDLPVRVLNAMDNSGIETVGDLVNLSVNDILKMRNLGGKSIQDINYFLREKGLKLRGDL